MSEHEIILFDDLSQDAKQEFIDFQLKEKMRHIGDVQQIEFDLEYARRKYGMVPRMIYVDKWVKIR